MRPLPYHKGPSPSWRLGAAVSLLAGNTLVSCITLDLSSPGMTAPLTSMVEIAVMMVHR